MKTFKRNNLSVSCTVNSKSECNSFLIQNLMKSDIVSLDRKSTTGLKTSRKSHWFSPMNETGLFAFSPS